MEKQKPQDAPASLSPVKGLSKDSAATLGKGYNICLGAQEKKLTMAEAG